MISIIFTIIIGIFTVVNITVFITNLMIFVVIMFLSSTSFGVHSFQRPHGLENQISLLRFWNRPPASEGQFRLWKVVNAGFWF